MSSGWTSWIRTAAAGLALAAGVWAQGAGAAEIKNVTAKYQWPWGVYIDYEVVGTIGANDPLIVKAADQTKNTTYLASSSSLSGDTGRNTGCHRLIWDLDKQGVKIDSTNVVFTVEYRGAWCVVDLLAGANAASYPVTYLNDPPSGGFNTDAYKTTKLVLRRIEPGTFNMGGSYQTTLSKAYYIGIFEVTQKQYELVTGGNPSYTYDGGKGDKQPVQQVSWNTIRGNANWPTSTAVSANSFMGRLRARTGLEFDLPTEAQWEYACRAGTTSKYNNGGNTEADLTKLGHFGVGCCPNSSSIVHPMPVGTYQPNAWGLYDMHGNVYEWCLDWKGTLINGATDPKGPSSGTERGKRGGCWQSSAEACTSSCRTWFDPSSVDYAFITYGLTYGNRYNVDGFRLVRHSMADEVR